MVQAHYILSNPLNQKLIDLYFFEFQRTLEDKSPSSLQKSAALARMYLSNCSALLFEENAFVQLEYVFLTFRLDSHEIVS
jgi:hypothetical protein